MLKISKNLKVNQLEVINNKINRVSKIHLKLLKKLNKY